jgi:hypothetical protein
MEGMGAGAGATQRAYAYLHLTLHPCLHTDLAPHQRHSRSSDTRLDPCPRLAPSSDWVASDWVDLRTPCCVGVDQQETRMGKTSLAPFGSSR